MDACIRYGALASSRDVDLALLVDAENLRRLQRTSKDLGATATFDMRIGELTHA